MQQIYQQKNMSRSMRREFDILYSLGIKEYEIDYLFQMKRRNKFK